MHKKSQDLTTAFSPFISERTESPKLSTVLRVMPRSCYAADSSRLITTASTTPPALTHLSTNSMTTRATGSVLVYVHNSKGTHLGFIFHGKFQHNVKIYKGNNIAKKNLFGYRTKF